MRPAIASLWASDEDLNIRRQPGVDAEVQLNGRPKSRTSRDRIRATSEPPVGYSHDPYRRAGPSGAEDVEDDKGKIIQDEAEAEDEPTISASQVVDNRSSPSDEPNNDFEPEELVSEPLQQNRETEEEAILQEAPVKELEGNETHGDRKQEGEDKPSATPTDESFPEGDEKDNPEDAQEETKKDIETASGESSASRDISLEDIKKQYKESENENDKETEDKRTEGEENGENSEKDMSRKESNEEMSSDVGQDDLLSRESNEKADIEEEEEEVLESLGGHPNKEDKCRVTMVDKISQQPEKTELYLQTSETEVTEQNPPQSDDNEDFFHKENEDEEVNNESPQLKTEDEKEFIQGKENPEEEINENEESYMQILVGDTSENQGKDFSGNEDLGDEDTMFPEIQDFEDNLTQPSEIETTSVKESPQFPSVGEAMDECGYNDTPLSVETPGNGKDNQKSTSSGPEIQELIDPVEDYPKLTELVDDIEDDRKEQEELITEEAEPLLISKISSMNIEPVQDNSDAINPESADSFEGDLEAIDINEDPYIEKKEPEIILENEQEHNTQDQMSDKSESESVQEQNTEEEGLDQQNSTNHDTATMERKSFLTNCCGKKGVQVVENESEENDERDEEKIDEKDKQNEDLEWLEETNKEENFDAQPETGWEEPIEDLGPTVFGEHSLNPQDADKFFNKMRKDFGAKEMEDSEIDGNDSPQHVIIETSPHLTQGMSDALVELSDSGSRERDIQNLLEDTVSNEKIGEVETGQSDDVTSTSETAESSEQENSCDDDTELTTITENDSENTTPEEVGYSDGKGEETDHSGLEISASEDQESSPDEASGIQETESEENGAASEIVTDTDIEEITEDVSDNDIPVLKNLSLLTPATLENVDDIEELLSKVPQLNYNIMSVPSRSDDILRKVRSAIISEREYSHSLPNIGYGFRLNLIKLDTDYPSQNGSNTEFTANNEVKDSCEEGRASDNVLDKEQQDLVEPEYDETSLDGKAEYNSKIKDGFIKEAEIDWGAMIDDETITWTNAEMVKEEKKIASVEKSNIEAPQNESDTNLTGKTDIKDEVEPEVLPDKPLLTDAEEMYFLEGMTPDYILKQYQQEPPPRYSFDQYTSLDVSEPVKFDKRFYPDGIPAHAEKDTIVFHEQIPEQPHTTSDENIPATSGFETSDDDFGFVQGSETQNQNADQVPQQKPVTLNANVQNIQDTEASYKPSEETSQLRFETEPMVFKSGSIIHAKLKAKLSRPSTATQNEQSLILSFDLIPETNTLSNNAEEINSDAVDIKKVDPANIVPTVIDAVEPDNSETYSASTVNTLMPSPVDYNQAEETISETQESHANQKPATVSVSQQIIKEELIPTIDIGQQLNLNDLPKPVAPPTISEGDLESLHPDREEFGQQFSLEEEFPFELKPKEENKDKTNLINESQQWSIDDARETWPDVDQMAFGLKAAPETEPSETNSSEVREISSPITASQTVAPEISQDISTTEARVPPTLSKSLTEKREVAKDGTEKITSTLTYEYRRIPDLSFPSEITAENSEIGNVRNSTDYSQYYNISRTEFVQDFAQQFKEELPRIEFGVQVNPSNETRLADFVHQFGDPPASGSLLFSEQNNTQEEIPAKLASRTTVTETEPKKAEYSIETHLKSPGKVTYKDFSYQENMPEELAPEMKDMTTQVDLEEPVSKIKEILDLAIQVNGELEGSIAHVEREEHRALPTNNTKYHSESKKLIKDPGTADYYGLVESNLPTPDHHCHCSCHDHLEGSRKRAAPSSFLDRQKGKKYTHKSSDDNARRKYSDDSLESMSSLDRERIYYKNKYYEMKRVNKRLREREIDEESYESRPSRDSYRYKRHHMVSKDGSDSYRNTKALQSSIGKPDKNKEVISPSHANVSSHRIRRRENRVRNSENFETPPLISSRNSFNQQEQLSEDQNSRQNSTDKQDINSPSNQNENDKYNADKRPEKQDTSQEENVEKSDGTNDNNTTSYLSDDQSQRRSPDDTDIQTNSEQSLSEVSSDAEKKKDYKKHSKYDERYRHETPSQSQSPSRSSVVMMDEQHKIRRQRPSSSRNKNESNRHKPIIHDPSPIVDLEERQKNRRDSSASERNEDQSEIWRQRFEAARGERQKLMTTEDQKRNEAFVEKYMRYREMVGDEMALDLLTSQSKKKHKHRS